MRSITALLLTAAAILMSSSAAAQVQRYRGERRIVKGGMEVKPQPLADSLASLADSLLTAADSLAFAADSLLMPLTDSLPAPVERDSLAAEKLDSLEMLLADDKPVKEKKERRPFISDSMGISRVSWLSAVLPGFGQIYNKQYWKLPILYSTVGASLGMFFYENNKYKPLKKEFDLLTDQGLYRTDELNRVQGAMIKHNTLREVYLGAAIASYIFFIGDAAVKYSTNDVSSVKRATTLAIICPGAGQVYNKSYWRLPIVLGGFATTIYCIDWNNRGYQRFKKAYRLRANYDLHPDDYPDGSTDEFNGRYSPTFLKNLRDSYRRNRDLCIILTAGLYILQVIDAHVDAHLRDFDISDDLSLNVMPAIDYAYSPALGKASPVFGMGIGINF
ncbi:MAG: hypothetical protein J1E04_03835 [Alistipes sp.]|nr:hypothetical protein [Alistipes sp.]